MKLGNLAIAVACIGLCGCVSEQAMDWSAYGGSRADATVEVGYQFNPSVTKPILNNLQADQVASERCIAWGYATAEAFGASRANCQQMGTGIYNGVCIDQVVTVQYQCLGDGEALQGR